MKTLIKFILAWLLINVAFAMDIAITVDDLPMHGDLPPHVTRLDIANTLLFTFKKHHIQHVYGLINGNKVNETPEGFNILKRWLSSGQLLGNHTYSHLDLAKINSKEYIDDITRNESLLSQLMINKNFHYFRYPYLSEGNTQEKRDSVRHFLFSKDYKIAPVTVDFFEYLWNDAYVRCVKSNDEKSIAWLKNTYLEQAQNALIISHELSQMLFGRDIKNVLLIHINAFSALMLNDLLTMYERSGVTFISLPEALKDPAYQINPNIVRDRAYTFLNQVRLSRGLKNPDRVEELYHSLPEETLENICK